MEIAFRDFGGANGAGRRRNLLAGNVFAISCLRHGSILLRKVLFLCTGNYYRSRYAEELFNHLAKIEGLAWRAFSRGAAEKGSPENVGPMSVFARDGLDAKGVIPEGATRAPQPCALDDFDNAQLVIALKEAEHRALIERRFPEAASRVSYWHVDDIEFAEPSVALAMIDDHVGELIASLRSNS